MSKILITGSNRGIGLEMCRQLAERGDDIIATCRRSSSELDSLSVKIHEGIDVTDDASVRALVDTLMGEKIDEVLTACPAL